MKQKRRFGDVILAASLLLLLCTGIYLIVEISTRTPSRTERNVGIMDVYPFLKDGEIFPLAATFPFDWDEVLIANAPGGRGDFYAELRDFDPSFSPWHDIHFLVLFYRDGKMVEYFQYRLGTMDITPIFGENHRVELNWTKRMLRENALFFCDGFDEARDGVYVCTLVSDM